MPIITRWYELVRNSSLPRVTAYIVVACWLIGLLSGIVAWEIEDSNYLTMRRHSLLQYIWIPVLVAWAGMAAGVGLTIRYVSRFQTEERFELKLVALQSVLLLLSGGLFLSGGFDDANTHVFTMMALGLEIVFYPFTITYVAIGVLGRCVVGRWVKGIMVVQAVMILIEIVKLANKR